MKAFWAGFAAVIVISAIAAAILVSVDSSSSEVYQSQHGTTRL